MKVTAVIVTRGDVDLGPCLAPILAAGIEDIVIRIGRGGVLERYAAARRAQHEIVYTQDDDCTVDVPRVLAEYEPGRVTCNMPEWKRYEYPAADRIALVGWGAVFHRCHVDVFADMPSEPIFNREADRVFTALNPLKLIDVPFTNLPWADGPCRMASQREHGASLIEIRRRLREMRRNTQI